MPGRLVLASASQVRLQLLEQAGLSPSVEPASIDEAALKHVLQKKNAPPAEIARQLAQAKARNVSLAKPEAIVIGADQILALDDKLFSKPVSPDAAVSQLMALQNRRHNLISAVAVAEKGEVSWQTSKTVELEMRPLSQDFVERYVQEEWSKIRYTVGCHMIEDRGISLFKSINGDYHAILGLPILDLLTHLQSRGIYSL